MWQNRKKGRRTAPQTFVKEEEEEVPNFPSTGAFVPRKIEVALVHEYERYEQLATKSTDHLKKALRPDPEKNREDQE